MYNKRKQICISSYLQSSCVRPREIAVRSAEIYTKLELYFIFNEYNLCFKTHSLISIGSSYYFFVL